MATRPLPPRAGGARPVADADDARAGQRALVVGAGTGYSAAVLKAWASKWSRSKAIPNSPPRRAGADQGRRRPARDRPCRRRALRPDPDRRGGRSYSRRPYRATCRRRPPWRRDDRPRDHATGVGRKAGDAFGTLSFGDAGVPALPGFTGRNPLATQCEGSSAPPSKFTQNSGDLFLAPPLAGAGREHDPCVAILLRDLLSQEHQRPARVLTEGRAYSRPSIGGNLMQRTTYLLAAALTLASSLAVAQTSSGSSAGGSSTSGGPAATKPNSDSTQHTPSTGGASGTTGASGSSTSSMPSGKDASTQGAGTAGSAEKKGDATSPGGTMKK